MKKTIHPILITVSILLLTAVFFYVLYSFDNKYNTKIPLPQDGKLFLTEDNFKDNSPIFLIDQWQINKGLLSPSQWNSTSSIQTYIGEYSNFKHLNNNHNPLGEATYQLQLNYKGNPTIVALELTELFSNYQLWQDNSLISEGSGTARANFLLTEGDHTLTIGISAKHGYYAGMYFPGSIGNPAALQRTEQIRSFCYALAFLSPLVLALFSLFLWKLTGSRLRGKFAFLCLSFSAYISYYFIQLWNLPFAQYWYLVEDIAFYAFLYYALTLSLESAGFTKHKSSRLPVIAATTVAIAFPAIEVLLYFLTPIWNMASHLHGRIQDSYRIFIFLCLVICSVKILTTSKKGHKFILTANAVLGIGILTNLIFSNLFEPIYTFWQMEWCGLLLVILFACMMVAQNKRILNENTLYQNQLEQMVDERTKQLSCLLEERRAFFSDMAHDLKAPLFATKTFIQMIRRHSVELDNELLYYIEQVEQKQGEMSRRVQSLNELNAIDKLTSPLQLINVRELLQEIYKTHNPEAVVSGIHLIVDVPLEPLFIHAQRDKLMVVFENLIYNALRFTPSCGSIKLSCSNEENYVGFKVEDSGSGIPSDELPHVFERFFIGEAGKSTGSGLGLYIVKSIIEEAGGTISVVSDGCTGTAFLFTIPVG